VDHLLTFERTNIKVRN